MSIEYIFRDALHTALKIKGIDFVAVGIEELEEKENEYDLLYFNVYVMLENERILGWGISEDIDTEEMVVLVDSISEEVRFKGVL